MYDLVSEQIAFNAKVVVTSRAFISVAAKLMAALVEPLLSRRNFGKFPLTRETFPASAGGRPRHFHPVDKREEMVV